MLQRLRHRAGGQEGFTLIELLVVILIIGILAAVAIPAFLNQQGKAQDSSVKADIKTAQTAEETYYTDNQGYTAASTASNNLTTIESSLSAAMSTATGAKELLAVGLAPSSPAYNAADPTGASGQTVAYEIKATSNSGVLYALDKWSDGGVSRSCQVPANTNPGGCKGATQGSSASTGTW